MTIRMALYATVCTTALLATGASATTHKKHAAARRPAAASPNRELLDEVRALKAQVEVLQSRIDGTTSTQAASASQTQSIQSQLSVVQQKVDANDAKIVALPAEIATVVKTESDKAKHYDKFYFKGITITPGGFLELAGIYRQHQQASDVATPFQSIPYGNSRTGYTNEARFTARQSRLSFLAQGDVNKQTKLSMYGEFDFLGAAQTANSNESNSYNPRIRHLYGTVDYDTGNGVGVHFLAGQTWSLVTLNSKGITPRNEVTPPQIDAQYVPGFAWARQPQVRLTVDGMGHHLWLAVSAENPQTTFSGVGTPAGVLAGSNGTAAPLPASLVFNQLAGGGSLFNGANSLTLNHVPDFVGKVAFDNTFAGHAFHVEGFGIYRVMSYRVNSGNNDISAGGFGGSISFTVVPKLLDVQFSGMTGRGIGRYGSGQLSDATFDDQGNIKPIHEQMLLAGVTVHATKMLDVYGFAGQEIEEARSFTTVNVAGQTLAYGYGNPLYTNAGCYIEGSVACNGNTHALKQITGGFWQKLYQGPFGRAQIGAQYSYTERSSLAGVGGEVRAKQNIGFLSFRYYPF